MATEFRVDHTPNPNAIKLTASKTLFEGTKSISLKKGDASEHSILNDVLAVEGVDNVFAYGDFITVNKLPDTEWDTIMPKLEEALNAY
jgi:hypothetical protein